MKRVVPKFNDLSNEEEAMLADFRKLKGHHSPNDLSHAQTRRGEHEGRRRASFKAGLVKGAAMNPAIYFAAMYLPEIWNARYERIGCTYTRARSIVIHDRVVTGRIPVFATEAKENTHAN